MKSLYISMYLVLAVLPQIQAQPACDINIENFANTMTVVAVLNIDGEESQDTQDQLIAKAGAECRGAGSPVYVPGEDRYYVFLVVASNVSANEEISFVIYDHSSNSEIELVESIIFVSDSRYGSLTNPRVLITDPNKIPVSGPDANLFFSPNNDGFNDTWIIRNNQELSAFEIVILDNAGNKLYEAFPYQNDWDGKYQGKLLPTDVYYFIMKSALRPEIFTGSISLIR